MFFKLEKPPDLPTSYRPISLLPYFSKILKRLILKHIYPHIKSNNVLQSSHFGFRAKHCMVHQVHRVVDAITTSLENKCYYTCAFLDISQAFDRVWHDGLLFKLHKILLPSLFLLMKSYLTDRNFKIRQGTATSNIATISAGILQGGILSPILFNIYAADQPTTQNTLVADYADDKVILSVHSDPLIAGKNVQFHLNLLSVWYVK
uniref:RNA-directed DNA polymerase from mobile element jockey n=1 Tax=Schizaphis graminum TaxID=13262 RepID=A0A2S2NID7_SCHGA